MSTRSTRLDELITSARARHELDERFAQVWDGDRAVRVREGALRRHEGRVRRDRALRRALVVAGGAGLLVLALLRAASSAPAESPASASAPAFSSTGSASTTSAPSTAEALAFRALADAGYARD